MTEVASQVVYPPVQAEQPVDMPTENVQSANAVAPGDLQLHEAATVEPDLLADSDDAV